MCVCVCESVCESECVFNFVCVFVCLGVSKDAAHNSMYVERCAGSFDVGGRGVLTQPGTNIPWQSMHLISSIEESMWEEVLIGSVSNLSTLMSYHPHSYLVTHLMHGIRSQYHEATVTNSSSLCTRCCRP